MKPNYIVLILASLLAAGCDSGDEKKDASPHYILYSPNAEPLNGGPLGHPTCDKAMSSWFERTDRNHDGSIDAEEFRADAATQFARMDIDKNGFLVSEELDRYRAPYRQEAAAEAKQKHIRHHLGNAPDDHKQQSQKQTSDSASLIDPVMSADSNLDFKVTREEFLAQSEKNFADLDRDHNGRLSRDEVLALCHKGDEDK